MCSSANHITVLHKNIALDKMVFWSGGTELQEKEEKNMKSI